MTHEKRELQIAPEALVTEEDIAAIKKYNAEIEIKKQELEDLIDAGDVDIEIPYEWR